MNDLLKVSIFLLLAIAGFFIVFFLHLYVKRKKIYRRNIAVEEKLLLTHDLRTITFDVMAEHSEPIRVAKIIAARIRFLVVSGCHPEYLMQYLQYLDTASSASQKRIKVYIMQELSKTVTHDDVKNYKKYFLISPLEATTWLQKSTWVWIQKIAKSSD